METNNKKVISSAGKQMLSFVMASTLSHNRKNLIENARNKNPEKRTYAEREALRYDVKSWEKYDRREYCAQKSEKNWREYQKKQN